MAATHPSSTSPDLTNAMLTIKDGMVVGDEAKERQVMAALAVFCCVQCEYPVLASFRFCPHCGVALMQMKPVKK